MKVSELTGPALDWAVAKCEGRGIEFEDPRDPWLTRDGIADQPLHSYTPSTDWAQGGPIIEREKIDLDHSTNNGVTTRYRVVNGVEEEYALAVPEVVVWTAFKNYGRHIQNGPTPLIAAARCFVASKLGDKIEIPEELK